MVVDLLLHCSEGALDFIYLNGLFGLLLVEGLEQIHHDLPDFRLNLVPLKFLDLYRLLTTRHLILFNSSTKHINAG